MSFALNIKISLATASVVFFLTNWQTHAAEGRPADVWVIPSQTGVLLLPALDVTRDATNMLAPRQTVIRHREEYEFITRQFKVMGEKMARTAADAAPAIELGDSSSRTATNLDLLAKRTGADWVAGLVVEKVKLDPGAGQEFQIHTRVRLQIWDARRHAWLADDSFIGTVSGSGSPIFRFKDSLDDAAKGSLEKLLSRYPQMVSVLDENSLKDYLAGRTNAFVGDPKQPFSGSTAEP